MKDNEAYRASTKDAPRYHRLIQHLERDNEC